MSVNHPGTGSTRCRHCLHQMAHARHVEAPWCINRACKLHGKLQRWMQPQNQAHAGQVRADAAAAGLL